MFLPKLMSSRCGSLSSASLDVLQKSLDSRMISWLKLSTNDFWEPVRSAILVAIDTLCLWMNFYKSISFLILDYDLSSILRQSEACFATQQHNLTSMQFLGAMREVSQISCYILFSLECDLGGIFSSSLGLKRKKFVSRVDWSVNIEMGDSMAFTMRKRASQRPPKSPSQSRMLYVYRYQDIRSMLIVTCTLMYLKRVLGFSAVGKQIQLLGKLLPIEKLKYSVSTSYPYCKQLVSSSSTFFQMSKSSQDGLVLSTCCVKSFTQC